MKHSDLKKAALRHPGVKAEYENLGSKFELLRHMPSSIAAALDRIYAAFGHIPKPRHIDACPCCSQNLQACVLISRPLRELSGKQLSAYGSKVFLTAGGPNDFRYFLPRLLEISINESSWWPSPEVLLGKLELAGWKNWSKPEREAVEQLIDCAVDGFFSLPVEEAGDVIDRWICAMALARMEVSSILARLEACPEILVRYYERNSATLAKGRLSNSFWSGQKPLAAPIVEWFLSDCVEGMINAHYARQADST